MKGNIIFLLPLLVLLGKSWDNEILAVNHYKVGLCNFDLVQMCLSALEQKGKVW